MSSERIIPMQRHLREKSDPEMVDDKELDAMVWQVAYALRGEKWLDQNVRYRILWRTTKEQRDWILRNALAQVSQSQMNPRANDPNYPLD